MKAFMVAATMLYLPYLWCYLRREDPADYGLRWNLTWSAVRLVFILSLLTLIPLTVMSMLWPGQSLPRSISVDSFLSLSIAGLVASVVEETFFRGFVQTLLKKKLDPISAILITALLFAAAHSFWRFHPLRLATFFPGLIMGYLRESTGNVFPSMIYHFLGNIWSIWFFPGF